VLLFRTNAPYPMARWFEISCVLVGFIYCAKEWRIFLPSNNVIRNQES
jgi:hypothetical protein